MVTAWSVLFTVLGMLGVTVLTEWFVNKKSRDAHRRAVKDKVITDFGEIIDEMSSMPARFKHAADNGKTLDRFPYVEGFLSIRVDIEALEPSQQLIDDLQKTNGLMFELEERYYPEKMEELRILAVVLKKHQLALNKAIW